MSQSTRAQFRNWIETSRARARSVSSFRLWILAALVGILTSIGVIGFTVFIEWLTRLTFGAGTETLAQGARSLPAWRVFLVPVAGGTFVAGVLWLASRARIIPSLRNQGIAEVIEARARPPGQITLGGAAVNTLATGSALGFGASAGREGPLVYMGGALATVLAQRFGLSAKDSRTLLGCAAAAAVAAAFNAPIAGVLFALEVILSNYALSIFGPVTLASVVSAVVAQDWLGNVHRFEVPPYQTGGPETILLAAGLGVIAGLVALSFMELARSARVGINEAISRRFVPVPLLPIIAGLIMGGVGLVLPEVLGIGYQATSEALSGNYSLGLLIVLVVAKLLATVICLACRFGQGVFSAGIFLGTMAGAAFGVGLDQFFPGLDASPTFFAMVGMGAVSGAILGAPISTTLIIFELTGDYQMTISLMVAVGIATLIVQIFFGSSWFHYLLNAEGYDLSDGPHGVILQTIRVRDAMRTVTADAEPLEEGAPHLLPRQSLGEALARMQELEVSALPVVGERDPSQIIGTLTHLRALRTYNSALIDSHIEHHR